MTKVLSIGDLRDIRGELFPLRSKWKDVGLELNIHPDTLDNIKSTWKEDTSSALYEVLKAFLKEGRNHTWGEIIDALDTPVIGETALLQTLRKKFCSSSTPEIMEDNPSSIDQSYVRLIKQEFDSLRSELNEVRSKLFNTQLSLKPVTFQPDNEIPNICKATVVITNEGGTYQWKGAGIQLNIPKDSLPKEVKEVTAQVYVTLGGINVPPGNQLVSPVYRLILNPKIDLKKKLVLQVEHAAEGSRSSLFFTKIEDSKNEAIPICDGKFDEYSSYGSLAVASFSGFAIAAPSGTKLRMISRLFYKKAEYGRVPGFFKSIAFVVIPYLEIFMETLDIQYEQWIKGPKMSIEFTGSQVMLDMPSTGIEVDNVKIIPVTPPVVFKEDVLKLFYSRSSPIIPACHLNVVRNAENEGLHGHHYFVQNTSFRPTSINVIGASSPNDYIVLGQKDSSLQVENIKKYMLAVQHYPVSESVCLITVTIGENVIYENLPSTMSVTQNIEFIDESITVDVPCSLGEWKLKPLNHPEIQQKFCSDPISIPIVKILAERKAKKTKAPLDGNVYLKGASVPFNYFRALYDFDRLRKQVESMRMPPMPQMPQMPPMPQQVPGGALVPLPKVRLGESAGSEPVYPLDPKKSKGTPSVTSLGDPDLDNILQMGNFSPHS